MSSGTCADCGHAVHIVARGLCRKCYDRARPKRDPLDAVAHFGQLSQRARAVVGAAVAYRRRTGRPPGIEDLAAGMTKAEKVLVVVGALEAIRQGAACYGLVVTWRRCSRNRTEGSQKRTKPHSPTREIMEKSGEIVQKPMPKSPVISPTYEDVGKNLPNSP